MNRELQEQIQAWIDGELTPADAQRVAALTQSDPTAHALADNLRSFRELVRGNPPEPRLDASREFYWSRIRQGIERAERTAPAAADQTTIPSSPSLYRWLAWLVPSATLALVTLFILRPGSSPTPADHNPQAPVLVGHVVETPLTEVSTLTFYSANDAMTVVWVGPADIL